MGGIQTSILNPKSVQESLNTPANSISSFEFIPEMAGKRRMWIGDSPIVRSPTNTAPVVSSKPTEKVVEKIVENNFTKATAKAIDKMPDIYELYDEAGRFIGQGSVQKFSLSQDIRCKDTTTGVPVQIQWRKEFNGYEITALNIPNPV
jgi:hypothetical protein